MPQDKTMNHKRTLKLLREMERSRDIVQREGTAFQRVATEAQLCAEHCQCVADGMDMAINGLLALGLEAE